MGAHDWLLLYVCSKVSQGTDLVRASVHEDLFLSIADSYWRSVLKSYHIRRSALHLMFILGRGEKSTEALLRQCMHKVALPRRLYLVMNSRDPDLYFSSFW